MYTFQEVLNATKPSDSWVGCFFINPINYPIVYLLANYTTVRPEMINVLSLFLGLTAGSCFLSGRTDYLYLGLSLLILSYIVDGIDGKLARLKKQVTPLGIALDSFRDKVVHLWALYSLLLGNYYLNNERTIIIFGLGYLVLLAVIFVLSILVQMKEKHCSFNINMVSSIKAIELFPPLRILKHNVYPIPSVTEVIFITFIGFVFFQHHYVFILTYLVQMLIIINLLCFYDRIHS